MSDAVSDDFNAVKWPSFGVPARVPVAIRRAPDGAAKQAARAEGYEDGRREGLDSARKETDALKQQLRNSIGLLGQARVQVAAEQIAALTEVSRAVCRRVLGVEMMTNPDVFETLIRAGIEHLGNTTEPVRVHVNPQQHEWLSQIPLSDVELVADEAVAEGAVSVRNARRQVDLELLAELDDVFERALNG